MRGMPRGAFMGCFRALFKVGSGPVLFKQAKANLSRRRPRGGLNPDTGRCFTQLQ
jgi:hypothetical protein